MEKIHANKKDLTAQYSVLLYACASDIGLVI